MRCDARTAPGAGKKGSLKGSLIAGTLPCGQDAVTIYNVCRPDRLCGGSGAEPGTEPPAFLTRGGSRFSPLAIYGPISARCPVSTADGVGDSGPTNVVHEPICGSRPGLRRTSSVFTNGKPSRHTSGRHK